MAEYLDERFEKKKSVMGAKTDDRYFNQRFDGISKQSISFPNEVRKEEMGPPGLGITEGRFSVAEGRNFHEKLKAFQKTFPEGELVLAPISRPLSPDSPARDSTQPKLLFKRNKDDKWAEVDPGMIEKFEPLADLVDFIGQDYGSIIGEVVSLIPQTKGIKLLPLLTRLFTGAATGDVAQQGIQEARGINTESPSQVASGAFTKGLGAAAGGAVGAGLSRGVSSATGGGLLEMRRGGPETIEAFKALNIPAPMPQQVARSPALARVANQAAVASSAIPRRVDEQQQAAIRALEQLKGTDNKLLFTELSKAEQRKRNQILFQGMGKNVEATTAGRKLQQSIEDWSALSQTEVRAAYNKARSIEEPAFDLSPAQQVAQRLEFGVPAATQDGGQRGLRKLDPELMRVIEDIKALDPSLPAQRINLPDGRVEEVTAIDQLQALKQELFDLKTPDVGVNARQSHALAGQLYRAIDDVIKAPKNSNPEFVQAWKQAEKTAAKRFDTLEKLQVQQIARSETPSQLALKLNRPGNAENIALLRRMKRPQEFEAFRDFAKSDLLRKERNQPGHILDYLNSMDEPTLNLIMSKQEQRVFREIGEKMVRFNEAGIQRALKESANQGRMVHELFRTNNSQRINEIGKLVQEQGRNSRLGRSVRAGLMDDIIESVTKYDKGGAVIDFNALNKTINEYQEKGLMRFLTSSDLKTLKNQRLIAEAIKSGSDVGASMSGAESAGNVFFRTSSQALLHMARLMGLGRFLTTDFASKFLIGTGKTTDAAWRGNVDLMLKAGAAAAGSVLADVEDLSDFEENR